MSMLERHKDNDSDAYDGLMVEYIDPTTGGPVFKTITFFVQMLHPGQKTFPVRIDFQLVVSPFEGKGHAVVDEQVTIGANSTPGDTAGSWFQYMNEFAKDPLILFVASPTSRR